MTALNRERHSRMKKIILVTLIGALIFSASAAASVKIGNDCWTHSYGPYRSITGSAQFFGKGDVTCNTSQHYLSVATYAQVQNGGSWYIKPETVHSASGYSLSAIYGLSIQTTDATRGHVYRICAAGADQWANGQTFSGTQCTSPWTD